ASLATLSISSPTPGAAPLSSVAPLPPLHAGRLSPHRRRPRHSPTGAPLRAPPQPATPLNAPRPSPPSSGSGDGALPSVSGGDGGSGALPSRRAAAAARRWWRRFFSPPPAPSLLVRRWPPHRSLARSGGPTARW
ncbi:Os11g0287000, partial [Oryza sativa Japonica Group]